MIPITVYARSDVCSIAIPKESGGCGAQHTRKVTRGVPEKIFAITCGPCESYLKGDRKQKILKYHIDAKTGQSVRQERIADADRMWAKHPRHDPAHP